MTNSLRKRVLTTVLAATALVGAGAATASAADHDPVPASGTVIMSNEEAEAAGLVAPSHPGIMPPDFYVPGRYY
ncbi:hypothetical protein [Streptomyces sp. NPDC002790]|uniref:hypothetical protein n=1 Tax=Streptomyces sp. NPDC002790 TaxID=3154431 RepID=UPI00331906A1